MIRVSIYGRFGGDPVERATRNGNAMITASLAVNAGRASEDEVTEWFSLVVFGKTGEMPARHAKADMIATSGTLTRSRFIGGDCNEHATWSVIDPIVSARTVRPAGRKRTSGKSAAADTPVAALHGQPKPPSVVEPDESFFDDELPDMLR